MQTGVERSVSFLFSSFIKTIREALPDIVDTMLDVADEESNKRYIEVEGDKRPPSVLYHASCGLTSSPGIGGINGGTS